MRLAITLLAALTTFGVVRAQEPSERTPNNDEAQRFPWWTEPADPSGGNVAAPDIAVNRQNVLTATWVEEGKIKVSDNIWKDRNANGWTTPVDVPGQPPGAGGGASNPVVAYDSNDTLHVVYQEAKEQTDGDNDDYCIIDIYHARRFEDGSWAPAVQLTLSQGEEEEGKPAEDITAKYRVWVYVRPQIASIGNTVHITWLERFLERDGNNNQSEFRQLWHSSGGSGQPIPGTAGKVGDPFHKWPEDHPARIAIADVNGVEVPHVAFRFNIPPQGNQPRGYFLHHTAKFGAWTSPVQVSQSPDQTADFDIHASRTDGRAHVVYLPEVQFAKLRYAVRGPAQGDSWGGDTEIGESGALTTHTLPRIRVDSRDQAHILWRLDGDEDKQAFAYARKVKDTDWRYQEPTEILKKMEETLEVAINRNDGISFLTGKPPGKRTCGFYESEPPYKTGENEQGDYYDARPPMFDFDYGFHDSGSDPFSFIGGGSVWFVQSYEPNVGSQDGPVHFSAAPGTTVNVATGGTIHTLPLFSTTGVGFSANVTLFHNSLRWDRGVMSPGWTHTYHVYLTDHMVSNGSDKEDRITLSFGDGSRVVFAYDDTHKGYIADKEFGYFGIVELNKETRDAEGGTEWPYRLTTKFGVQYAFDDKGKLKKMVDTNKANLMNFEYTEGVLTTITDTMERSTTLEYDPENLHRLKNVIDPGGKSYEILYWGAGAKKHVKSVEFKNAPNKTQWQYDYFTDDDHPDDERINLISKITTPRGFDWNLLYYPDNRLLSSQDPPLSQNSIDENGDTTISQHDPIDFTYNDPEDPTVDDRPTVEVTNRRSQITKVEVEYKRSLVRKLTDAKMQSIEREFDGEYRNLTKSTDREGNISTITYEENSVPKYVRDNVQKIEEPSPDALSGQGAPVPSAQYTYETQSCQYSRVKSVKNALGHKTEYTIDANGNVTEIKHPVHHEGKRCVDTLTVDDHGRVEKYKVHNSGEYRYGFDDTTGLLSELHRPDRSMPSKVMYTTMGETEMEILPLGGMTKTEYDGLDLPCRVQLPDGDEVSYVTNEYDEEGRLILTTGPGKVSTAHVYDELGRLIKSSSSSGNGGTTSIEYFYDPEGNLRKTVTSPNAITTYEVDELGRRTKQCLEGGASPNIEVTSERSPNGWVTRTSSAQGSGNSRAFLTPRTSRGAVKSWAPQGTGVSGIKDTISYYDDGILGKVVRTKGGKFVAGTLSTYDNRRKLTSTKPLTATTVGTSLNSVGSTITGGSRFKRDCNGLTVEVTDPSGRKVTIIRDRGGRPVEWKDNEGQTFRTVEWTDNDLPRLERVTHPETNQLIVARESFYNQRNEVKRTIDASGNETLFAYDTQENLTEVTTPLGGRTQYEYDNHGNLIKEIRQPGDPGAQVWRYEYTSSGNPRVIVDPKGNRYEIEYDAADRMIRYFSPEPGGGRAVETRTYNQHGQVATMTDRSGKRTAYSYDGLGRLTTESHIVGQTEVARIVRSYDGASRPISIHDTVSKILVTYTTDGGDSGYDDRGRLLQMNIFLENTLLWKRIRYTNDKGQGLYDEAGNLLGKHVMIGRSDAGQPIEDSYSYAYDGNSRLTKITRVGGLSGKTVEALIGYSTFGARQFMSVLVNGSETLWHEFDYDERGRTTRVRTIRAADQSIASSFEYTYDDRARPTGAVLAHLDTKVTWSYDVFDRLKSESWLGNANPTSPACAYLITPELQNIGNKTDLASLVQPGQPVTGQVTAPSTLPTVRNYIALWDYDTLGNRTGESEQFSLGGTNYSSETQYFYSPGTGLRLESESRTRFDEAQLPIETTNISYTYTRNGSLSKRITDGVEEQWFYNYQEVAGAYIKGAGVQEAWVYNHDPLGNRIAKRNLLSQQEDWFLVEGGDVLAEYHRTSGANVETLKHTYFNGVSTDSKIARIDATGTAETAYFYTDDKMGTVHHLLDETGAEHQRQLSNAWGEDLPDFDSLIPGLPDPHGFHQRRKDVESGLMYFRNRLYDPTIGRFTQQDPILGNRPGEHYLYALNNPLLYSDPLGLQGRNPDMSMYDRGKLEGSSLRDLGEYLRTQGANDDKVYLIPPNRCMSCHNPVVMRWAYDDGAGGIPEWYIKKNPWILADRYRRKLEETGRNIPIVSSVSLITTGDPPYGPAGMGVEEEWEWAAFTLMMDLLILADPIAAPLRGVRPATVPLQQIERTTATQGRVAWRSIVEEQPVVWRSIVEEQPVIWRSLIEEAPISKSTYAFLRARSPDDAARFLVNRPGSKVDLVYGEVVAKLEAGHIPSMKQITTYPGFASLTPEEQLLILNRAENFIGLTKAVNASMKEKSWLEWLGHSKKGPVPASVRAKMVELEQRNAAELQQFILRLLSERK